MECEYCNKKIKTKYNLDKHIKAVHSIDKDDAKYCTICGHLKNLDEFYKTKYNTYMSRCKICNDKPGSEKIKCNLCDEELYRKNLKRHKKNKYNYDSLSNW